MRSAWLVVLGAAVSASGAIAACGSDDSGVTFPPGPDGGSPDVIDNNPFGEGGGDVKSTLTVMPQNVVLTSNGTPVTQAYNAFVNGAKLSNANSTRLACSRRAAPSAARVRSPRRRARCSARRWSP